MSKVDSGSPHDALTKTERSVIQVLSEHGAVSHEQLCEEIGVEWDDMSMIIRSLRQKEKVQNRIDRLYELT